MGDISTHQRRAIVLYDNRVGLLWPPRKTAKTDSLHNKTESRDGQEDEIAL